MKVYIVSFNALILSTHELLGFFDTRTEILNWYLPFPGTIVIVSNHNQTALANMISERFPLHIFLITETNSFIVDGRLPNPAWEFIRNPKSSGRLDNNSYTGLEGLLDSSRFDPKK